MSRIINSLCTSVHQQKINLNNYLITGHYPTYVLEHLATFSVSPENDMLYPADGMRRYRSQNYLVTDQSIPETRVSDFGTAMEKKGFLKTSVDQDFSLKLWGENYEKPFFLTRMSNIVSSLVSIIIPFSGLFLVSKKCIFWSSFESDFWKDRKFSGKNYLIISFKMEVSCACGQPKQGFYLFLEC